MKNLIYQLINWIKNLFKKEESEFMKAQKIVTTVQSEKQPKKDVSNSVDYSRNFPILNERPENMSFREYKNHLKKQKAWIKERKKGFLVYKAAEIFEMNLENKDGSKTKEKMHRTFPPFRGVVANLKPI